MGVRLKEEEEKMNEPKEEPHLNDLQFTKLDELLTQTQLYSEFLLENMDTITKVSFLSVNPLFCFEHGWQYQFLLRIGVCICQNGLENDDQTVKEGNEGRGSKRKAGASYDTVNNLFNPLLLGLRIQCLSL